MATFSRRSLARYAADQLVSGKKPAEVSRHLAAALINAKMQKQTDLLLADINEELEGRGLLATTIITSATKLSAGLRRQLTAQIKIAAGVKEVSLNEVIDLAVIGGAHIETSRHTWDKTVARSLAEIKGGING